MILEVFDGDGYRLIVFLSKAPLVWATLQAEIQLIDRGKLGTKRHVC